MIATENSSPLRAHGSLGWDKTDACFLACICLGAALAIRLFWTPGIASNNDMLIGIYRVFELDQSWHQQLFYPRLGMNLNFSYGGPLFQFYAPLASYLSLVFYWAGLGFVEANKAVFTLSLVLASFGTYVYLRWLLADRRAALLGAMAYLLAPYLLLDVYERGALAEILALALIPWIFNAFHRLLDEEGSIWFWISAGLLCLLVVAHNITALSTLPFLLLYGTFLAWRAQNNKVFAIFLLAIILGLGLAAFYWLPALVEHDYSQIVKRMIGGPTTRAHSILAPLNHFVQSWLAFDYWGDMRFRPALWQIAIGSLAVVSIGTLPKKWRYTFGLWAGAVVLLLLLQTDLTRTVWRTVGLAEFLQFPWRLLGLTSFFLALLIGTSLSSKWLAGKIGWLVFICLVLVIGYGSLRNLDPARSSIWFSFSSDEVSMQDLYERGRWGFALFNDFLPITTKVDGSDLAKPRRSEDGIPAPALDVIPQVRILEDGPAWRMSVSASAPFILRLHRIFFPGWQIYIDDRPVSTYPYGALGLVAANLPAGHYEVVARFTQTPLRQFADIVSYLALAILGVGLILNRSGHRVVLAGIGVALILIALAVHHQGLGETPRQPTPYSANFQDEIYLLGYQLDHIEWRPGDTFTLRLYWLVQKAPADNYKTFIHLVTADDVQKVGQTDSEPIFGYSPTTRWEAGEVIADQYQVHLDATTPPGSYRLLIGMYRTQTMKNLEVRQASNAWPGDRVVLTNIEIRAEKDE